MENDLLPLQEPFQEPEKNTAYNTLVTLLVEKLPEADTLTQFYGVVREIMDPVNSIYDNLQCKTGCSRCCKFYGSPQMYRSEWDYIRDFIENNFTENDRKRVYRKFRENTELLKEYLESGVATNNNNDNFSLNVFLLSECPFLFKGSCSIYEARPLICRIFGNSLISRPEFPANQNILTCTEERQRWESEALPGDKIYLPYKEKLESYLLKITKPEDQFYNTIQFWLTEYFNEY
jgi:Fe-S-cluster containining protein